MYTGEGKGGPNSWERRNDYLPLRGRQSFLPLSLLMFSEEEPNDTLLPL